MRTLLIQRVVIQWWQTFKINVTKNAMEEDGIYTVTKDT